MLGKKSETEIQRSSDLSKIILDKYIKLVFEGRVLSSRMHTLKCYIDRTWYNIQKVQKVSDMVIIEVPDSVP